MYVPQITQMQTETENTDWTERCFENICLTDYTDGTDRCIVNICLTGYTDGTETETTDGKTDIL